MRTKKLVLCSLMVLGVISLLLAGCGGKGGSGDPPSNSSVNPSSNPTGTTTTQNYSISGSVTVYGTAQQGVSISLNTLTTTTTDASGNYSFSGLANGNYTVTPSQTGYTFNPTSSAQTVNGANVTSANFLALPNANGSPDTSFNGTGYAVFNPDLRGYHGYAMTKDANGKILVTGDTLDRVYEGNRAMVIWRYNTDGTLDTTFNGTGYNKLTSGNYTDAMGNYSGYDNIGYSITVDSNGKIIVAGATASIAGDTRMGLWRFNSDGTLDTSFNGTGYIAYSKESLANSVITDASNRIIVAGHELGFGIGSTIDKLMVWRFNSNGTLDTSFNGTGYISSLSTDPSDGRTVQSDASGNILVAGSMSLMPTVWRYNTSGQLDTSFNSPRGYAQPSGTVLFDDVNSMIISTSGKILLVGAGDYTSATSTSTYSSNMIIWQFNTNGTLDTGFNGVGYVKSSVAVSGPGYSGGNSITMDSNGKILVAGYNDNAIWNNYDMVVWRYNADGTVDTSFDNPHGFIKQDGPAGINSKDVGSSILVDGNGKIVVAGTSSIGSNVEMVLWRYNPN